ncbi:MAG: penicillin-binding transpeptidase domain-containing protein [Sandaracinaceae bacterium]
MLASRRTTMKVGLGVGILGAALGFLSGPLAADSGSQESPPEATTEARSVVREAASSGRTFLGLDPLRHRVEDGVTVADLSDGSTAVLTLDPGLQAHATEVLERYEVPYGAIVAIEPSSGRVLAYVSHSSADPNATDMVLDPGPPTASVFKIITGAALVDAEVDPSESVCFHGGASRVRASNLEDDPARDRRCATLGEAMGGSLNCVFAKLADRNLDPMTLERTASAFGFGETLPFDVPTRISPMEVPTERLEFARTAAGFWHMHMSPLHGALIAATIASGGEMPRALLVDQVIDHDGGVSYQAEPETFRRVISTETATQVGELMRNTVRRGGTARRHFFDRRGNAFLPGIDVAGKTGTLNGSDPYREYSWFVGFAPAEAPTIAVAALVVNEPRWRIKGAFAAREALRYYLVQRPREQRRMAREAEQEEARRAEQAEQEAAAAETAVATP